jgi:hypothetical protein
MAMKNLVSVLTPFVRPLPMRMNPALFCHYDPFSRDNPLPEQG